MEKCSLAVEDERKKRLKVENHILMLSGCGFMFAHSETSLPTA